MLQPDPVSGTIVEPLWLNAVCDEEGVAAAAGPASTRPSSGIAASTMPIFRKWIMLPAPLSLA